MIFVDPPYRDYRDDFLAVATRRRSRDAQRLLLSAANRVLAAYDRYTEASADAGSIRQIRLHETLRAALESNYRAFTGTQIYGDLLQRTGGRCPMCGFGEASTLDHYLPRIRYPQYCVFAMNLIPACAQCNLLKGEAVGLLPNEQYLHAYFHRLPKLPLLRCEVVVEAGTIIVSFSLRNNRRVHPDLFARMTHDFRRLRLADRFRREATTELGDRALTFRTYGDSRGYGGLRDYLRIEAQSLRKSVGPNHWKTALYAALSTTPIFWSGGFRRIG